MDKEFYSYPCEDSDCCINFLESGNKMSFEDFCLKYCENCPDCVVLDVSYGEWNVIGVTNVGTNSDFSDEVSLIIEEL